MSPPRTLIAAAVTAAVSATVLAITVWPSEAATAPVGGGVYTLAAGASGKCIDVTGASADNSALLVQVACNTAAKDQQWTATARANGQFNLVNGNSTRCIDVPSASSVSGTQLQQYGCGDGTKTNQLWTFTASTAASGKYLVKSVATGLCISDKDGSTAGNNPIVEETCSDVSRMQWSFNYVSGSTSGPTTPVATTPAGTKPTVAADGSGTYKTVQAAIDAVPANNTTRRVITIKAGTYREIVTIPSNKPYVTLQGLGSGPSNTVIVNNHSSAGGYGTSGSATVFVEAHDFAATNLTMSNDYGEGSQAVAARLSGDRSVYSNVRFLGNQDTLYIYKARSYIVNSYVEGTVDFIFGGGTAVFNSSSIYERRTSGGPITAANTDAGVTYGLLFYKCTITGAVNNTTQLGRPWGAAAQVLYRESSLSATIKTSQPWTDMSDNSWKNARFYEYRNTGSGAGTNSNRPQLSDAQAPNYTPQKYLAGTDGWNPL
ncbi:pectinesterase family protein [Dactylosporangium sp. NPDC051541]|uniref:pectinesterase family protein n=1 Tax=Dactylosporangium sp. NPDC051541 TaxID=3363977 RepID=UPI003797CD8B